MKITSVSVGAAASLVAAIVCSAEPATSSRPTLKNLSLLAQVQIPPAAENQPNLPPDSSEAEITVPPSAAGVEESGEFAEGQTFSSPEPDLGTISEPAPPATVMTAEELAALSSQSLEDPFDTQAAAAGARNTANAQRAANTFTIAGVIHVGDRKIAAVRETSGARNSATGVQYLANEGETLLKIPTQPDLKLNVMTINSSSVTLEVEGTNDIVTIR